MPGLFYQMNYSGVPAPTTIGVIARYNGELESQVQVAQFTAQNSGGTVDGAIRANISPDAQGFTTFIGQPRQPWLAAASRLVRTALARLEDGPRDNNVPGATGPWRRWNRPTQGGLTPGEYVFYIYTGSRGDVYNVKDGTVARDAFIADEKGFLGMFSCGVSTEPGLRRRLIRPSPITAPRGARPDGRAPLCPELEVQFGAALTPLPR